MHDLPAAAFADAGPLIHLDEIDALILLDQFRRVLVPSAVELEAQRHRPGWRDRAPAIVDVRDPRPERVRELAVQLGDTSLDPGELAALALWYDDRSSVLLCDDLAARRAAVELGCDIAGTLGILLTAARSGRLPVEGVRTLVSSLPERSTLHLSRALVEQALSSITGPE